MQRLRPRALLLQNFVFIMLGCVVSSFVKCCSNHHDVVTRLRSTVGSRGATSINGLCAVLKPKGMLSRVVVDRVKDILDHGGGIGRGRPPGIKVGHGGTLDPMAEGVIVLGIGSGTKLLDKYLSGSKGYSAVALLGKSTDTLDITGTVLEERDCSFITSNQLERSLAKFQGSIMQIPPMYSALRKDGKRLHELARQGVEVDRPARGVTIYSLQMVAGHQWPYFGLQIECGGGTYVRSLIDDICKDAGAIGCMTDLIRTKQAVFTLDHCLGPEDWAYDNIVQHVATCNRIANVTDKDLELAAPKDDGKYRYARTKARK
jgi:tRNA pseudouridine55 synthase